MPRPSGAPAPGMTTPWQKMVLAVGSGRVYYPSKTGEILARVVDRREARRSPTLMYVNSVKNESDFRQIASTWARILRNGLDKAHGIGKK